MTSDSKGTNKSEPSYYELLGVARDASTADIRKAYKRLAMKYHPDRNPGNPEAEEMFKKLSHAYEILSNDDQRKIYDTYGEEGLKGGGYSSASAESIFRDFFSAFGGGDDDMFGGFGGFGSLFGMGRGSRSRDKGPRKTKDLVYELPVSLKDMYCGRKRKLKITKNVICPQCEGTGSKTKSKPESCLDCKGKGMKVEVRQMGPGFISQSQTVCPTCRGEGTATKPEDRCRKCSGQRVVQDAKIIEVDIDKGTHPGEKLVFEGEADQMPDAIPGDVIVVITQQEEKDGLWYRTGDDLVFTKHITLVEALTGFEFVITHLDGHKVVVRSEPRDVIKPGDVRMIAGEGMPLDHTGYEKGRLFIRFEVEFPTYNEIKNQVKELKRVLPPPMTTSSSVAEEKEEAKRDHVEVNEVVAKAFDYGEEKVRRSKRQKYRRGQSGGGSSGGSSDEDESAARKHHRCHQQ